MKKAIKKRSGFLKHAHIESLVLQQLSEKNEQADSSNFSNKNANIEPPCFVETHGDLEVFSIAEINTLWEKAENYYGEDRKKFARNQLNELAKSGNRKYLAKAPDSNEIDVLAQKFPNFGAAIEHVRSAVALSNLTENRSFEMSPILLIGEPGLGKTAFCQALAKILKTRFKRFDVGCMSTASILVGLSFSWSTGHCGEVLNTFMESDIANPVFLLDELDKISGHSSMPILPTLLSLLEPESSSTFKDEALLVKMNCSKAIWIASANDIEMIAKPLLSRFTVIQIEKPNKTESDHIINSIYQKIRSSYVWGRHFEQKLDTDVVNTLNPLPPREVSIHLKVAFGNAARRKSTKICKADLALQKIVEKKIKMGFI